jgi:hypothetical protein
MLTRLTGPPPFDLARELDGGLTVELVMLPQYLVEPPVPAGGFFKPVRLVEEHSTSAGISGSVAGR